MTDAVNDRRETRVFLREIADRWKWRVPLVQEGDNAFMPPINEVIAGILLHIMDNTARIRFPSTSEVDELRAIRRLLTPVPALPPPPADDGRAARERASRVRAWAAYQAAGGTMGADDGDDEKITPSHAEPIAVLNLPGRAWNALRREAIGTVGALVAKTAGELLELKNFGRTTLWEVRDRLAARGLKLAGD